jgi:hypothetical protein
MSRNDGNAILESTKLGVERKAGVMRRFPRLSESAEESSCPQDTEDKLKAERAVLEKCAFALLTRRRQLRVELGKTFVRIKATLEHGHWKSYFAETFASSINLRTAQRYMDLVRGQKADSKNDIESLFPPAKDPQAVQTRAATAKAKAEVGTRWKEKARLDDVFKRLTRALVNSPDWPSAHVEIIALLKQLCVRFRVADKEAPLENSAA